MGRTLTGTDSSSMALLPVLSEEYDRVEEDGWGGRSLFRKLVSMAEEEHRTICYNVWCLQLQLSSVATEDPLFLAASLGMKHCQQSLLYQGLSPCLLELLNRGR